MAQSRNTRARLTRSAARVSLIAGLVLGAFTALGTSPASAQGLFATAIQVNDKAITQFELQDRIRFLRLLRAPGDPNKLAREQLIDDRLKLGAAQAAGVVPTEDEIKEGMAEFAGRANLELDEFVKAITASGVSEETFRDFVRAGLSWRQLVGAKFGGSVTISEDQVDRALASGGSSDAVQVLLSEIIMVAPPRQAAAVQQRAEELAQITSIPRFAAQARRFSAAATRARSGRLDWMPITKLPPQLRPLILALAPGEVTAPIPLNNAVALFQMRDIKETERPAPDYAAIEYAAYYIPGGRSEAALAEAARISGRVDRCDDLYGIAKGKDPSVLERGSKVPGEIPTDIALELSRLDPGETSAQLTRANGQTLVLLMLCGRTPKLEDEVDRGEISLGLRNARLESLAEGYLDALRADARIVNK